MAIFTTYTYQFSPIEKFKFDQVDLWGNVYIPSVENLMAIKNKLFEEALLSAKYTYRKQELKTQLLIQHDNVLIFKLAVPKSYTKEVDFVITKDVHHPSLLVIVDNNKHSQQISIEQNRAIFADTSTVIDILSKNLNNALKDKNLNLSIKKRFRESEFWEAMSKYSGRITMLRFHFQYPNLPNSRTLLSDEFKATTSEIGATSATAEFKSDKGQVLVVNESNEQISQLNKEAANTGNGITFRISGEGNKNKKVGISQFTYELSVENFSDDPDKLIPLIAEMRKLIQ